MKRLVAAAPFILAAVTVVPAQAQTRAASDNDMMLVREAAALESAGDMAGAEQLLRTVLDRSPASLNALIALERVLSVDGRIEELIPVLDRLLEQDPESPIAHRMRLKAYSALDRPDAVENAGDAWIAATPGIETPYREVARIWQERNEPTRAVRVLEQGRRRIQRPDALALELGDVYAAAGDPKRAVGEWDRAVGPDGRGFLLVQRRIAGLPNGGALFIPGLVDALTKAPATPARQRAAVQLAIEAGLGAQAAQAARELAASLDGDARRSLLVEVARRADGSGLDALAYWAYRQLVESGGSADQMLAVRTRLAELALAVGDTADAARLFTELESAYPAGSPQRRQAVAVRIQMLARDGEVDRASAELDSFRKAFPEAAELDAAAAAVANARLDRGDVAGAERTLTGVRGPQSGVARGRMLIARGEIDRGRNELLASAPMLRGAEATEAIALATLLGRLSQPGGEIVAKAMARATDGAREEGVALLFEESAGLPDAERAAILGFAASLADRVNLGERAEQIRREIVAEYPDTRAAPMAMLTLARNLARENRAPAEARMLLETLILEHSSSALVPQARRELDRLLGRVPPPDEES